MHTAIVVTSSTRWRITNWSQETNFMKGKSIRDIVTMAESMFRTIAVGALYVIIEIAVKQ